MKGGENESFLELRFGNAAGIFSTHGFKELQYLKKDAFYFRLNNKWIVPHSSPAKTFPLLFPLILESTVWPYGANAIRAPLLNYQ